ncbi:hypothetical protein ASH01_11460 [Terrabacter sp. Soil811]|uniref:hypothetical protein n=1 Tax=Terrabacter sp. Soil811 TaxID=1736419 RepID=UPI0007015EC8|nr:hypothetical protein [Terrabacter sp. Soil811]KRF44602.1 hypothetical protein ASH01_11460 [Terrabacter sp. Soil811]
MSTATPIDRGLYAVPAPPQQERFALLLRLRRAARQALDTLLALPRGAAGWVLRQARTVVSALGGNPLLQRLGARLSSVGDLFKSVGPLTAAAAVLSIPAVWKATVRVARFLGSKIAAGASVLWQQTRSLLGKLGPTGTRVATGLANAGTVVRGVFAAVVTHPVTQTVARGVAGLAGLVRPVSQTTVLHQLLGRLIGSTWLRWGLEVILLPLVLIPGRLADLTAGLRATPAPSTSATSQHPDRSAPFAPVPDTHVDENPVPSEPPTKPDNGGDTSGPHNRAERRAAQQAQTHAKRTHARH